MKQLKNEKALFKKAMEIGEALAVKSGFERFKPTDSAGDKAEAIYRMLVHLKLIVPLPEDKENGPNIRHRLVKWIAGKLPEDHPLLK